MNTVTSSLLLALAASLGACGGGGSDGAGSAAVSTMTASPTRYSQTMIIAIVGRNLLQGIEVFVDGPCSNLVRAAGGTDDAVQYTCLVDGVGEIVPRVRNAVGQRELASVRAQIPLPQVSVTLSDGTQSGTFIIELDPVAAPLTVQNFIAYASGGNNAYFRNTAMTFADPARGILLGGYNAGANGVLIAKAPTRSPIPIESDNGLKNVRGAVAMYRRGDASSAANEWLINTQDNPSLDRGSAENPAGFAVFGKVVDRLDVVEVAAAVATAPELVSGSPRAPIAPVRITAISQTR